jgi:hypothetical protein
MLLLHRSMLFLGIISGAGAVTISFMCIASAIGL